MDAMAVFEKQIKPRIKYIDDCWIFTGPTKNGMHGCVKVGGRKGSVLYTHRIAFEAFNRLLVDGEVVMHLCNVARCCNPKHLRAGSQSDNIKYAYECGAVGRKEFSVGAAGLKGVHFSTVAEKYRYIRAITDSPIQTLYHGKDFFEACCRRKSWENAREEKPA